MKMGSATIVCCCRCYWIQFKVCVLAKVNQYTPSALYPVTTTKTTTMKSTAEKGSNTSNKNKNKWKKYQEVTSDIAPKEQFWIKMAEVNFLFSKVDLHVSCLNLKCCVYIVIHLCLRWEIVSVHQVWMSSNLFF